MERRHVVAEGLGERAVVIDGGPGGGAGGTAQLERPLDELQLPHRPAADAVALDGGVGGGGGRVGFSLDHAKSWAAYTTGGLSRGDTIVYTGGNAFRAWSASAVIAASDEIVIESPNPEALREIQSVTALGGGTQITISRGAIYTYSLPKMVRWRDFYPALFLPEDQISKPFLTHDRRLNWTLDITLEVDLAIITAGYSDGIAVSEYALGQVGDVLGHTKATLDSLLASPIRGSRFTAPASQKASAAKPGIR